ncbi:LacI family DNA-binding transcriptional regulator [Lichenibacterium minor]|uniref:LacI family DNA-binding transcriptional regulator n=1 Tax=Lichenibacterium minor TaxID=2316528 RepID=A0A4Q2U051_9HYPH|nr:LacI family DNA-binding transcriptional regulator [Lichenibacterium minor]RYC29430.1 LacI family DNA-binding transcriptional regulator [Lichenibacterium minor]
MPRRDTDQPGARVPRPPTIADVAAAAGVSRSAVSRSFTEGASAAPGTRAKVLAAAASLGYRPSAIARSLTTRRSHLVAVSTVRLENGFNASLLQALALGLDAIGLRTLLFPIAGTSADADPSLDEILRHRVDAVALLATRLSSRFSAQCASAGVPVVLINRTARDGATSSVTGDNVGGARRIAEFLVAGGHRRFAFLAGVEDSSNSRDRERGFADALREAGGPAPLRAAGRFDRVASSKAVRRMLAAPEPPDALFCANDHMALAAIDVARREFNLAVGHQISIVGFDDAPTAALSGIDLTSFSQPPEAMAGRAVAALAAVLADPARPAVHETVAGELVVRGSARLPAAGLATTTDGRRLWVGGAVSSFRAP